MNRNDVIEGRQCCSQGRNGADAECGNCPYNNNSMECGENLMADALEYIRSIPDIVRCGKCRMRSDGGFCSDLELYVGENFFCAVGRRKIDDEGN